MKIQNVQVTPALAKISCQPVSTIFHSAIRSTPSAARQSLDRAPSGAMQSATD